MARSINRLSAKQVQGASNPGHYCDGLGLYLQVGSAGSKSWVLRYKIGGKGREMGLGSLTVVSLAEARAKAAEHRKQLLAKIDPLAAREAAAAAEALDAARTITFAKCAEIYIGAHKASWKNDKNFEQWTNTINTYCADFTGLPVQSVDTDLVFKALEPIWTTKHQTATRLRGRIESVLDWAKSRGYRAGENPARWKGHMSNLLPKVNKRRGIKHHPALPVEQMPEFMKALRLRAGTAARTLEFLILTAVRTSEATGAKWPEFDEKAAIWTIPAARMKASREHRVPLSPAALAVIAGMKRGTDFVFPGQTDGEPQSGNAMLALLERMGHGNVTVHGFRSTFRDWASELTDYSRDVCEMALAHAVENQVEAAYRRGDLLEKRVPLMNDWADYCAKS